MIISDLHCDTVIELQAGADLGDEHSKRHVNIAKMRQGNIGLEVFVAFVSSLIPKNKAFDEANKLLDLIESSCQEYSQDLQLVEEVKEVKQVFETDEIAVMLAIENGHIIENDLNKLEQLRLRKVRYMTLTHSKNIDWAASSAGEKCEFNGLTSFGEKVVAAMNEMGMIIDVSHVHESTFWRVIRLTKRPIIASHSNASKICPIARNLSDDQIKAVVDTGGMVGVNFFPGFLDKQYSQELEKRCGGLFASVDDIESKYIFNPKKKIQAMHDFAIELERRMHGIHVGVERIFDHIDHILRVAGDDAVGFGSDFDGVPALPDDVKGCEIYPELIDKMIDRGIPEKSIEKICYKNFLRVLEENRS